MHPLTSEQLKSKAPFQVPAEEDERDAHVPSPMLGRTSEAEDPRTRAVWAWHAARSLSFTSLQAHVTIVRK